MPRLGSILKPLPTLLRVGFADAVAYRAEFLVWILATNMPLVMLALWTAVAREHPMGAYGQREFTAYFLSALVVRLFTGSWVLWELNYELRHGLLGFRLLRPFPPILHYAAENVAALPIRSCIAVPVALTSLYAMGLDQVSHDPRVFAVFCIGTLGALAMNFLAMAIIACLGFFIESSLAIGQIWFGLYTTLSGYLVPIDLFPGWLRQFGSVAPFRYMLSFPVETILGKLSLHGAMMHLGMQWGYIALFAGVLAVLWKLGMRRFSAFGG